MMIYLFGMVRIVLVLAQGPNVTARLTLLHKSSPLLRFYESNATIINKTEMEYSETSTIRLSAGSWTTRVGEYNPTQEV